MRNDTGSDRHRRISAVAQAYRYANDILSGALAIAVCAGLGYWLDLKTGWKPALTIIGACLGFVSAGLTLRSLLRRLDKDSRRRQASQPESRDRQDR